jgi:hypothetical protein
MGCKAIQSIVANSNPVLADANKAVTKLALGSRERDRGEGLVGMSAGRLS